MSIEPGEDQFLAVLGIRISKNAWLKRSSVVGLRRSYLGIVFIASVMLIVAVALEVLS